MARQGRCGLRRLRGTVRIGAGGAVRLDTEGPGRDGRDGIELPVGVHGTAQPRGVPPNEGLDTNPSIASYLPVFAKASIDAGADAFFGTGVHVLRGIEIYKDRPIFYGLGEFFRQMDVVGLAGIPRGRGGSNSPPIKYESIVAVSEFQGGQLSEVHLHPIELTYDVRMAHRGLPRLASSETGQRILRRLQRLSDPLGTTIEIEGDHGVIRVVRQTSNGE